METDLTDTRSCCSKSQSGRGRHRSSALIFLGAGCSSMLPNAMCLIQPTDSPCSVYSQALMIPPECNPNYSQAVTVPPECNPNYRCNTSLLIDYSHADRERKYVLIDSGKNFREQIILTREHADAVFRLDDIRDQYNLLVLRMILIPLLFTLLNFPWTGNLRTCSWGYTPEGP
ncbi:hypothetical protein NE237_031097 [Protea cynaroides]|uniref:Uncharacterized protein n=1 Tax=Protea cynaroides TaxID=273540 RepID=A0A9Q0R1T1_9MAGN|nr:hypothetical protein NE237_031097 [Protea cynaroides]